MSKYGKQAGCGPAIIGLILILPLCILGFFRWYNGYEFDRDCGGYLKRAADANSISLAREQMDKALSFIERKQLTEGRTTIIFDYPANDIGFWYKNLKESTETLRNEEKKANLSELERSNVLMKLRETLLDHSKEGDSITVPPGIAAYPSNVKYCVGFWITGILAGIGCLILIAYYGEN